jgi:predicted nuclease of predicted toxin-antitoxin system
MPSLETEAGRKSKQDCARLFEAAGHDTSTVHGQNLCGANDMEVIGRCSDEARALVTLDLDFSNSLRSRPSDHRGIVVLRPRSPASLRELEELCRTLIGAMTKEEPDGKLWIVEIGRLRIYQEGPSQ